MLLITSRVLSCVPVPRCCLLASTAARMPSRTCSNTLDRLEPVHETPGQKFPPVVEIEDDMAPEEASQLAHLEPHLLPHSLSEDCLTSRYCRPRQQRGQEDWMEGWQRTSEGHTLTRGGRQKSSSPLPSYSSGSTSPDEHI